MNDQFRTAARVIKQGGVIAYPAEACFGLGCDPRNVEAIQRIRKLKDRSPQQGFILVSDTLQRVLPFIDWKALAPGQRKKINASWPGPVTWLIPALEYARPALTGQHDTLAVRITAFPTLRALCDRAQSALVSTSANSRGQEPLNTAAEVGRAFASEIDYIIDMPIQGLDKPSRIIDSKTLNTIRL